MWRVHRLMSLAVVLALASACAGDDPSTNSAHAQDDDASPSADDDNDDDDNDDDSAECDPSRRPIVWVYGIIEDGDSFSTQSMRFASNNYCLDQLFVHDWNAFDGYANEAPRLAQTIDAVLAATDAAQVDLIAHSLGAGVVAGYLADPAHAAKVAHYAQIAALPCAGVPNGVPALNLSSRDDYVIGICRADGMENIIFDGLDHMETATSAATFAEVYPLFNEGSPPATAEVVAEDDIRLAGRAVLYFTNEPAPDAIVRVFEVDPATGERRRETPDGEFTADADGAWGEFAAASGAYYEFVCLDPAGDWPPLHYYREPFPRSNRMVYFRVYPPPDTPLGWLFSLLPSDDETARFSWGNVNRTAVAGRDALTADGFDLATPEIAAPEFTTLSIVFGDFNANGASDLTAFSLLPKGLYIKLVDLAVPTAPRRPIVFTFNGRTLATPNWPAESEGISTVVFE